MKKSNSKQKALGAFKKLGAVALITATLAMCFTACNQTGGTGGGGGKPKHAINFSVAGTGGTLKAEGDGITQPATSPINVEEGKEITFTAKANDGYRVKGWTLDGSAVNGTNTEYKLKVTQPATVKVSFEAIPPTKYTVTLNQTANGNVTASPTIPQDGKVDENTVITFTATANEGYKIGKWTVTPKTALQAGTGADGSKTAKVKITADTSVSVSFTKKTYAVNFSVAGTGGTLKAEGDGITQPATSPITVEHGKEVIFTAKADDGYRVKGWTLDGNAVNGTAETYTLLAVTQLATVKVSFELIPQAILTLSPDKLTIEVRAVTEDGSAITVEGCKETTLEKGKYTELHAKGTKVILKGNITGLSCPDNKLTSLNVQGLTALQGLSCEGNKLTELNVQGLTALKGLGCSGNQLTELNVQGLTALRTLNCSYNKLTALNVQGLTALQTLGCFKNQLTSLNAQGCTSLQVLGCYHNKLTELNVQGLTSLQSLNCSSNQLNAQAMTELLKALPSREASAKAVLYTKETGETEGNHKDYTQPADLKKAFEDAKSKNWKLQKVNANGDLEDI